MLSRGRKKQNENESDNDGNAILNFSQGEKSFALLMFFILPLGWREDL
jgi:hypothetical protein